MNKKSVNCIENIVNSDLKEYPFLKEILEESLLKKKP
jgi:hypothetical protein